MMMVVIPVSLSSYCNTMTDTQNTACTDTTVQTQASICSSVTTANAETTQQPTPVVNMSCAFQSPEFWFTNWELPGDTERGQSQEPTAPSSHSHPTAYEVSYFKQAFPQLSLHTDC